MADSLRFPQALQDDITAHAREEAPREACGLLAGRGGVVTRVIRCANAHPQPTTRYVIDPREQLAAFRSMDAAGEEHLGIYHSHPVSPPYPSPTDRAEAHYPDVVYVLVSVRTPEAEVAAFRIGADDFIKKVTLIA